MSQMASQSLSPVQPAPSQTSAPVAVTMPKSFKRRAGKACSFCQWRKIRCNVEERHPCSNCVLERIECSITKTRKSKYAQPQNFLFSRMGNTYCRVTGKPKWIMSFQIKTTPPSPRMSSSNRMSYWRVTRTPLMTLIRRISRLGHAFHPPMKWNTLVLKRNRRLYPLIDLNQ